MKPGPGVAEVGWTSRTAVSGGINEAHTKAIPAQHGVVCVRDAHDGVIALASTGNMRSFLADRLGPTAQGGADLRQAAAAYEYSPCSSLFEADLAFMSASAEFDPGLHDRASRKLRIWWLGTPVEAKKAQWMWDTDPAVFAEGTRVIGPFSEKAGARRHAERLNAAFELCRYPAELHKSPMGRPCAYKEMGQCPGVCDGSEPLERYEGRLREAARLDADSVRERAAAIEKQMQDAVCDEEFERAARLRSDLGRWQAFGDRQLGVLGEIGEMTYAAVTKSAQAKSARLMLVDRGRWTKVALIDAETLMPDAQEMVAYFRTQALELRAQPGHGDLGVLGVLGRELLRPSRGGPELVRLDGLDGVILLQAVKRVLRMAGARPRKQSSDE